MTTRTIDYISKDTIMLSALSLLEDELWFPGVTIVLSASGI